jgi:hypothetical protein
MTLREAIAAVRKGHAQRIAVPGKWKVWRDSVNVKHERMNNAR